MRKLAMAFPEILAIRAAISKLETSLAAVPINLAICMIMAPPTAIPIHFQETSALDLFDQQRHGNQVFLDFRALHEDVEFLNFIVGSIEVDDKNLFREDR